jgi:hypothetical protein
MIDFIVGAVISAGLIFGLEWVVWRTHGKK